MKKHFWTTIPAALILAAALLIIPACGDDDDDDDDDSTDPGVVQCQDYVESFFGSDGCYDDEVYYDALYDDCQKVSEPQNVVNQEDAWACLDSIGCDDYEDALTLYQDVTECLAPVFQ